MKRYALITVTALLLCAAPAHAQQSGEPEVTIPGNPDQPQDAQEGQYSPPDGGSTIQSLEEGLENVDPGIGSDSGNDAVVGTGSYVEGLAGLATSKPVEAKESVEPEPAYEKPSETYTELPDTGGVPFAGLGSVAVGIVASTGLLLQGKSHRGSAKK